MEVTHIGTACDLVLAVCVDAATPYVTEWSRNVMTAGITCREKVTVLMIPARVHCCSLVGPSHMQAALLHGTDLGFPQASVFHVSLEDQAELFLQCHQLPRSLGQGALT